MPDKVLLTLVPERATKAYVIYMPEQSEDGYGKVYIPLASFDDTAKLPTKLVITAVSE